MKVIIALLILTISASINAYKLLGFAWQESNIPFYIGFDGDEDGISAADYEAELDKAMTIWGDASNFKYRTISEYKNSCLEGEYNSVKFADNVCGRGFGSALAVAIMQPSDENNNRANIYFNSLKTWGIHDDNSNTPTDFKRIALHEVGHTLGLDHSLSRESIIYPTYQNRVTDLQSDDFEGIAAIYGSGTISIATPAGVGASDGDYGVFVEVFWDVVIGSNGYKIYRSDDPDDGYLQITTIGRSPFYDSSARLRKTHYYKIRACTGPSDLSCSADSDYDSGYRGSTPLITISAAADAADLSFITTGDNRWYGQTATYYLDGDAVQSGDIGDRSRSCMQASVGDGELSFYWKVSSEVDFDYLFFYINDLEQDKISGETDWVRQNYVFGGGENVLKWCYVKDNYVFEGRDAGWVDEVIYTPFSPLAPIAAANIVIASPLISDTTITFSVAEISGRTAIFSATPLIITAELSGVIIGEPPVLDNFATITATATISLIQTADIRPDTAAIIAIPITQTTSKFGVKIITNTSTIFINTPTDPTAISIK